jgi:hypothetical protein
VVVDLVRSAAQQAGGDGCEEKTVSQESAATHRRNLN